jgi:hypothetical protein
MKQSLEWDQLKKKTEVENLVQVYLKFHATTGTPLDFYGTVAYEKYSYGVYITSYTCTRYTSICNTSMNLIGILLTTSKWAPRIFGSILLQRLSGVKSVLKFNSTFYRLTYGAKLKKYLRHTFTWFQWKWDIRLWRDSVRRSFISGFFFISQPLCGKSPKMSPKLVAYSPSYSNFKIVELAP